MSGDKMSGDNMPLESVPDQYKYKDSAAGAPSGHGAAAAPPRRGAPAAPPRRGAPAAPPRRGAPAASARRGAPAAPPRRGAPAAPPRRGAPAAPARTGAAAAPPPGYGAPPGHAPPQLHYAQPQYPKYGGVTSAAPRTAVGVPPSQMMMMQPMGQWTTGLFDCGQDPSNSVITCLLPCITFGQVAEVVDQGTTSCLLAGSVWVAVLICFLAPCFVSCLWRTKLRAKYNLPQDEIGDLCIHFWCEPCALCQEYRELANRGLDPSLGWEHHRQQMCAQPTQMRMGAPRPVYMQR